MDPLPDEIIRHYEAGEEGGRLSGGLRALERLRTQELIERHLTGPPCRVLDVGGATGVYAQWLADRGHDVLLIDVVPSHVEAAQQLRSDVGRIDAQFGDARALPVEDDAFDHALALGPLYHLTERDDRVLALREGRRAVKTGGLVFAAVISRFASLFDGLSRQRIFEAAFAAMVERDLVDGQHRNQAGLLDTFTTAYFHHPDETRAEVADAGLDLIDLVGLEGMAVWPPALADRMADAGDRELLLKAARAIESEPTLLGLSPHLLAVARVT